MVNFTPWPLYSRKKRKTLYTLNSSQGGPQSWYGHFGENINLVPLMDQSKLKNVWSYTRVFTVWTRTLTFSPDRIFKTEYRLFCFRGFPQYLKVNAQTISRLGITASLQILPNLSSSIHLNIDATENETRPSYNKPQKEPECTLYTNCMRKCYTSYSKIFITRKIHAKAYQSPFSDDVHICCIAISYKLHLSM